MVTPNRRRRRTGMKPRRPESQRLANSRSSRPASAPIPMSLRVATLAGPVGLPASPVRLGKPAQRYVHSSLGTAAIPGP